MRIFGFLIAQDSKFAAQADHGEAVGAVRRQFVFVYDVLQGQIFYGVNAYGRVVRQNPNAVPFFRQEHAVVKSQFVSRAEHTVRFYAAQLGTLDLDAARKMRAVDSDGNNLAFPHVGSACDDLQRFTAYINLADD